MINYNKIVLSYLNKLSAQALLGQGDHVVDVDLEWGHRIVSFEGGDWKFKDVPTVKKQTWHVKLSGRSEKFEKQTILYDWEFVYTPEASWGVRLPVYALDLKYKTVWKPDSAGWWRLWDEDPLKNIKSSKERETIKDAVGSCIYKFSGNERYGTDFNKMLDDYLLKITKAALIVDDKDINYLAMQVKDANTLTVVGRNVAIAVDGEIEVDSKGMYMLEVMVKGAVGINDARPEIKKVYKPHVQGAIRGQLPKPIPVQISNK